MVPQLSCASCDIDRVRTMKSLCSRHRAISTAVPQFGHEILACCFIQAFAAASCQCSQLVATTPCQGAPATYSCMWWCKKCDSIRKTSSSGSRLHSTYMTLAGRPPDLGRAMKSMQRPRMYCWLAWVNLDKLCCRVYHRAIGSCMAS